MQKLTDTNKKENLIQSSKGNQMKWYLDNFWYKADYTGYEGFVEYVISHLVSYSDIEHNKIVIYETEKIEYNENIFKGCKSQNFLPQNWQLITLERLFFNYFGESLYKNIYSIENHENRVKFIVEQTIRITNLKDFGVYLSILLTLDAFFLNEDRHTHNIAVLLDEKGKYHYCPIFDNGAGLLSDTTIDYPLSNDIYYLIKKVKSKTFSDNFDVQLDTIEKVYGAHIKFNFTKKDLEGIIERDTIYSSEIKNRVREIIYYQMQKYQYLFLRG